MTTADLSDKHGEVTVFADDERTLRELLEWVEKRNTSEANVRKHGSEDARYLRSQTVLGNGGTEGRATGRNPGYGCVGQSQVIPMAGPVQDDEGDFGGALPSRYSSPAHCCF